MSQAQTFAERLSALRAQQKMGIRELGRAVGVTGMHISNLEKGKSAPSAELVLKLAEALEANVDELLHLADQVSPEVVDVILIIIEELLGSGFDIRERDFWKLHD